jgi:hypothetical protein
VKVSASYIRPQHMHTAEDFGHSRPSVAPGLQHLVVFPQKTDAQQISQHRLRRVAIAQSPGMHGTVHANRTRLSVEDQPEYAT